MNLTLALFLLSFSDQSLSNSSQKRKREEDKVSTPIFSLPHSTKSHRQIDFPSKSKRIRENVHPTLPTSNPFDGLSGRSLSVAQAISRLWGNSRWITQSPQSGLSPISLKSAETRGHLRQIAELTQIKSGEMVPDGFPPIVLQVLRECIEKNEKTFKGNRVFGWSQKRNIKDTLEALESRAAEGNAASSSSGRLVDDRTSPPKIFD